MIFEGRLPFKTGIEMSAVPIEHSEDKDIDGSYARKIAASLYISHYIKQRHFTSYKISPDYRDGHCLEFPSPVFERWDTLELFYKIVSEGFKAMKARPHHPATVCGGNHIHFNVTKKHGRAIIRDIIQHPEIGWVFTQPDDTESASAFLENGLLKHSFWNSLFEQYQNPTALNWFKMLYTNSPFDAKHTDTKSYAAGFNNNGRTIEFRCAEAPRNWSEMQDQLFFFIQYALWVEKNVDKIGPIKSLMTYGALQNISMENAIKRFEKLLAKIGLPKERYQKYINRNLKPRWEDGRRRA